MADYENDDIEIFEENGSENEIADTVSSLDCYLDEIGRYPLLSEVQEKQLADLMHNGKEAEKALAKDALTASNLRLVVHIIGEHVENFNANAHLVEELISAGNGKLMKIVEGFHPERFNTRFSTYAYVRIKDTILHELQAHYRHAKQVSSLDESLNDETGFARGDALANEKEWWEIAETKELLRVLRKTLDKLDARDRDMILTYYFSKKCTFDKLAKKMKLSRQRVCQIYTRAFARLKKLFLVAAA